MDTLQDVLDQIRVILGDQVMDWTPDSYLYPIVNHIYKLINLRISDTSSPYVTKVVEIIGVPVGTTSLQTYQADKANITIYGLFNPFNIQWKQSGQPVSYYRNAIQKDILPNVAPGAAANIAALYWEWREYIVYLTPLGCSIDLLVRGEYAPVPLTKPSQLIGLHPLIGAVLAEEAAACAARERANPGQMQAYDIGSEQALDDIKNELIRSQQGTTVRLGRLTRQTSRSSGPGYGNGSGWGL